MPDAELRVVAGTRRTNQPDSPPTFHLQVSDHLSGEILVDLNMSADQWLSLISGTSTTLPGFYTSHPERLGRKMVVRQENVPRDVLDGYNRQENELQADHWARMQARTGETCVVRSTNQGWNAIYRSWPEEN